MTVVRHLPVCQLGLEAAGLECLGGAIEPEREESEEVTLEMARRCAEILVRSKHAVVYTGAGVSTATGIPDYRGPDGVWTALATGRIPDDTFDWTSASPSFAHMCIARLVELGLVKFCVSTNLDCLHCKSGLKSLANLAELHGNKYVERCVECGQDYFRLFPIRRSQSRLTGRLCSCGGDLMDSGIDFGQQLPKNHLDLAERHAEVSDFSLVIGSSARVRPASELPLRAESLCVVNRQDTGLDEQACIRSYGFADVFFRHLMNFLGHEVRPLPPCSLLSLTHMRRLASQHVNTTSAADGSKEEEIDDALFRLEAELLANTCADATFS